MSQSDTPQIYLISPPHFDLDAFGEELSRVLDAVPVACMRLSLATGDPDEIARAADACRDIVHARDIPLVIEKHAGLVERLGLDGVHLTDGPRSVRATRKSLGGDAIIGAACGTSRHDGMTAGEAGADYICFAPVGDTGLGEDTRVPRDLLSWWSEMIELPVVAEGALDRELIADLRDVTDFFALGSEIWSAESARDRLLDLTAPLR